MKKKIKDNMGHFNYVERYNRPMEINIPEEVDYDISKE